MLLTRSPLYSYPEGHFRARLACLIHTANVRSEPGSNPSIDELEDDFLGVWVHDPASRGHGHEPSLARVFQELPLFSKSAPGQRRVHREGSLSDLALVGRRLAGLLVTRATRSVRAREEGS